MLGKVLATAFLLWALVLQKEGLGDVEDRRAKILLHGHPKSLLPNKTHCLCGPRAVGMRFSAPQRADVPVIKFGRQTRAKQFPLEG